MSEMLSLLLEDAGYEVDRQFYLGSTAIVHEGMVNGDIDAYVEYTGTGLIAILGQEVPTAERAGRVRPCLWRIRSTTSSPRPIPNLASSGSIRSDSRTPSRSP